MEINFDGPGSELAAKRADRIAQLDAKRSERAEAKERRREERKTDDKLGDAADDSASTYTAAELALLKELGIPAQLPTTADEFWAPFNSAIKNAQRRIERDVAAVAEERKLASKGGEERRGEERIGDWTAAFTLIQQLLNDCTRLLPPFDQRKAQSALDDLAARIEEGRGEVLPRKKFAFSSKHKAAATSAHAAAASKAVATEAAPHPTPLAQTAEETGGRGKARWDEDEHTIENRSNEVIVIPFGQFSAAEGGSGVSLKGAKDFRLLNLVDCVVFILDITRAIRVDDCTNTVVLAGPTAGSVLLHKCTGCRFWLASRQIRIHTSKHCIYYLHVQSRPIVEHCTDLQFAPYQLHFPGALDAFEVAGLLGTDTSPLLWKTVDDFGWHRVQRSPNWAVLPRDERPISLPPVLQSTTPSVASAGAAECQRLGLKIRNDSEWAAAAHAAEDAELEAAPEVASDFLPDIDEGVVVATSSAPVGAEIVAPMPVAPSPLGGSIPTPSDALPASSINNSGTKAEQPSSSSMNVMGTGRSNAAPAAARPPPATIGIQPAIQRPIQAAPIKQAVPAVPVPAPAPAPAPVPAAVTVTITRSEARVAEEDDEL